MARGFFAGMCVLALLGCGHAGSNDPDRGAWVGRVDTVGDTITVTTHAGFTGAKAPITVDSVVQLGDGVELERPDLIVRLSDGTLLVSDGARLLRIGADGRGAGEIGRKGSGPGEFRNIVGLGVLPGDTIVVLDAGLHRATWLSADGAFIRSEEVPGDLFPGGMLPGGVRLPVTGDRLVGGLGMISPGVATPYLVNVQAAGSDSARLLASVDGPTWIQSGRGLTPSELFGVGPVLAVARDGRAAYSNQVRYCIHIDSVGAAQHRQVCRDFEPVTVTDAVRHPDVDAMAARTGLADGQRESLKQMLDGIHVGDHHDATHSLRFDDRGRLWVRIIDSLQAGVHPWLMTRDPSLRPKHFVWDVYGRDGKRAEQVRLPSGFDPREFAGDTVWGIVELETGEKVVGRGVVRP